MGLRIHAARRDRLPLGVDEDGDSITSVVWTHLRDATPKLKAKEASPEQIVRDFIRDHDGEFKKSDIQKAMSGRGVPVKRPSSSLSRTRCGRVYLVPEGAQPEAVWFPFENLVDPTSDHLVATH